MKIETLERWHRILGISFLIMFFVFFVVAFFANQIELNIAIANATKAEGIYYDGINSIPLNIPTNLNYIPNIVFCVVIINMLILIFIADRLSRYDKSIILDTRVKI